MPGRDQILAVKSGKLVQLDIMKNSEKVLHEGLSDPTILLGFVEHSVNKMMILQGLASEPTMYSLDSGEIILSSYDKKNPEDLKALKHLKGGLENNRRDYGNKRVYIEEDRFKQNVIYIERKGMETIEIHCPERCTQPALTEDGRKLVFVDQMVTGE